jgi:2-dehydro-3-deoxygluconokinase
MILFPGKGVYHYKSKNNMILCFGEILLRMSPQPNGQWIHDSYMPVFIGGAELNTAVALAKWGLPVKYFSALPNNNLSLDIKNYLEHKNINVSQLLFQGNKIGNYFLPQGTGLSNADVVYDRELSSFSQLKPGTINWDAVFENCSWFHFSTINAMLNKNIGLICLEAVKAASAKGLTISIDLNYRPKLYTNDSNVIDVISKLVNHCDFIMGNLWSVERFFGIKTNLTASHENTKDELLKVAKDSINQLRRANPKAATIVYTFRMEKQYYSIMKNGDTFFTSHEFDLENTIDKAGSGDCFMAGIITSFWNNYSPQKAVNFASAAAVGKMKEKGDSTNQSIESILNKIYE